MTSSGGTQRGLFSNLSQTKLVRVLNRARFSSSSSAHVAPLPEDITLEILSRVGDVIAVVHCAATWKAWRRLILEPYFLSRRRAGPSSLLGFFFRDTSQKRARRRRYLRRPTRFLLLRPSQPQAATVLDLSHFLPNAAGLSGFNVVASGVGGLLVLSRARGNSCDPVRICVCDPMAGTSTFLPPLPPTPLPENVVFLDADGSSFRLLAAMETGMGHARKILLRVFSSRTGQWGTAVIAQPPDNLVLCLSSPAVVHRGAVHWICGTRALQNAEHALAVRPGEAEVSVSRFDLPPRAGIHRLFHAPWEVRLSSSSQGCLSLVLLDRPVISVWNFQDDGKSWVLHKTISDHPSANRWISIAALCDQSGSVFLRSVSGEGLFVLNLETEMMSEVWHREYEYECPYMPDLRSCLGAMKSF